MPRIKQIHINVKQLFPDLPKYNKYVEFICVHGTQSWKDQEDETSVAGLFRSLSANERYVHWGK